MSFSGLKTAVINTVHNAEQKGEEVDRESLAASFSAAVADTLVPRTEKAIEKTGYKKLAVAGGVAANAFLRRELESMADRMGCKLYLPPLSLCGDNAAMIGAQAYFEFLDGNCAGADLNAYATMPIDKLFGNR